MAVGRCRIAPDREVRPWADRRQAMAAVYELAAIPGAHLSDLLGLKIALHDELADLGVSRSISRTRSTATSPVPFSNARAA